MEHNFLLLPESFTSQKGHQYEASTHENENKEIEVNTDTFYELIRFITIGGIS